MDNPSYTIPDDRAHMWITGYFPNGFKASFTLSVSLASAFDEGMAFTQRLAAQGFTINPPGLESGEERFLAARVVRREKFDERRNRNVAILDLYTDHGKFRELGVYLNEPEDETAFEQAAGVTLASLPLCENDAPFKLDGDLTKANKYLRTLPKPLGVVRKHNPAYDSQTDNKKAKWLFVRWEGQTVQQVDKSTGEIANEKPATPKGHRPETTADAIRSLVEQHGKDVVKAALGVEKAWSDFTGTAEAAREIVNTYLLTTVQDVPF